MPQIVCRHVLSKVETSGFCVATATKETLLMTKLANFGQLEPPVTTLKLLCSVSNVRRIYLDR